MRIILLILLATLISCKSNNKTESTTTDLSDSGKIEMPMDTTKNVLTTRPAVLSGTVNGEPWSFVSGVAEISVVPEGRFFSITIMGEEFPDCFDHQEVEKDEYKKPYFRMFCIEQNVSFDFLGYNIISNRGMEHAYNFWDDQIRSQVTEFDSDSVTAYLSYFLDSKFNLEGSVRVPICKKP